MTTLDLPIQLELLLIRDVKYMTRGHIQFTEPNCIVISVKCDPSIASDSYTVFAAG